MLSVCYKNIITLSRTASTMHFAQKSGFKFVHYSDLHTASTMRYDKGTTKKAADQGKEENDMKNWTLEDLYELWRDRGYSKKQAKAMAEKDFNEMHRKKSDIEKHQIMQEMVYN